MPVRSRAAVSVQFSIDNVSSFAGSISNSGALSGGSTDVDVRHVGTFNGGIINASTGTITGDYGIGVTTAVVFGTSSAGGGISNAGKIVATGAGGVYVSNVTTFLGGITNSGTITAANTGIEILGSSTIHGSIVDSGNILASTRGILIESTSKIASTKTAITVIGPTFTGGISNAGVLTATGRGIAIGENSAGTSFIISTFSGGITNTGTSPQTRAAW